MRRTVHVQLCMEVREDAKIDVLKNSLQTSWAVLGIASPSHSRKKHLFIQSSDSSPGDSESPTPLGGRRDGVIKILESGTDSAGGPNFLFSESLAAELMVKFPSTSAAAAALQRNRNLNRNFVREISKASHQAKAGHYCCSTQTRLTSLYCTVLYTSRRLDLLFTTMCAVAVVC